MRLPWLGMAGALLALAGCQRDAATQGEPREVSIRVAGMVKAQGIT